MRWAAIGGVVVLVATSLLVGPFIKTGWVDHLISDLGIWWHTFIPKVAAGQMPYVDLGKEYPVLAGLMYGAIAQVFQFSNPEAFFRTHAFLMAPVHVSNVVLLHRLVKDKSPLFYLLMPTALIIGPFRYEHVVVTFTLLGYRDYAANRTDRAILWWSIGTWFKWYPAFFIAIHVWRRLYDTKSPRVLIRPSLIFFAIAALCHVPLALWSWMEHGHVKHLVAAYLFHARRPLYWDTVLGVWQLWLGYPSLEKVASLWSIALMAGVLLYRPRLALPFKAVAVLASALILNRLYSPQFHLWFYPLLLIGAAQLPRNLRNRILIAAAVIEGLNIAVYPFLYTGASDALGGFAAGRAAQLTSGIAVAFSVTIIVRALLLTAFVIVMLRLPNESATPTESEASPSSPSPRGGIIDGVVILSVAIGLGVALSDRWPPSPHADFVEAEDLVLHKKSPGLVYRFQSTRRFKPGSWSRQGQMFMRSRRKGRFVELALPTAPGPTDACCTLSVYLTQAADYGRVQVSMVDLPWSSEVDLFAPTVRPAEPVVYRSSCWPENAVLRLEVMGTSDKSTGLRFQAGIDGVGVSRCED